MEVNAENTLTGYLHNVSPVKKSNDTLYFEMQMNLELAQNIGALSAVNNWQLLSIKVKVMQLSGIKAQSTPYGMKKKAEAYLSDPHASIKLVLWETFTKAVQEVTTYEFKNLRVCKDRLTRDIYVNIPADSNCTIEETEPFAEPCNLPSQLPSTFTTSTCRAEILGVDKYEAYRSCRKCNKRLPDGTKVKCKHCKMKQNVTNCALRYYVLCLVKVEISPT